MKKLSRRAKVKIVKSLNDAKFELAKNGNDNCMELIERVTQIEEAVKKGSKIL